MPRRTSKFSTKYNMMIEEIGNKDANIVPKMWTKPVKHESEYSDISGLRFLWKRFLSLY